MRPDTQFLEFAEACSASTGTYERRHICHHGDKVEKGLRKLRKVIGDITIQGKSRKKYKPIEGVEKKIEKLLIGILYIWKI